MILMMTMIQMCTCNLLENSDREGKKRLNTESDKILLTPCHELLKQFPWTIAYWKSNGFRLQYLHTIPCSQLLIDSRPKFVAFLKLSNESRPNQKVESLPRKMITNWSKRSIEHVPTYGFRILYTKDVPRFVKISSGCIETPKGDKGCLGNSVQKHFGPLLATKQENLMKFRHLLWSIISN